MDLFQIYRISLVGIILRRSLQYHLLPCHITVASVQACFQSPMRQAHNRLILPIPLQSLPQSSARIHPDCCTFPPISSY